MPRPSADDEPAGPGPSSSGLAGPGPTPSLAGARRPSLLAPRLPGMTSARWRRSTTTSSSSSTSAASLPPGCSPSAPEDWPAIAAALSKLLLFTGELGSDAAESAARATYERRVEAGDILVTEGGGGGSTAARLFIVKDGAFEVRERRAGGSHVRTALKGPGDAFGEAGLLLAGGGPGGPGDAACGPWPPPPSPTTVAATCRGAVWVLERRAFRRVARAAGEARSTEVGLFLNAVPALARLDGPARAALAAALRPLTYPAGAAVFREGDPSPPRPGEPAFFIIRSGEAVVHARAGGPGAAGAGAAGAALAAGGRPPPPLAEAGPAAGNARAVKLNHLFRGDCFGERALLAAAGLDGGGGGASAPLPPPPRLLPRRTATVEAVTDLAVLALDAPDFFALVAPGASDGLAAAKAPPAVAQRLLRLHARGAPAPAPATVLLHRLVGPPRGPADPPPEAPRWEVVRARGHLDEVMELVAAGGGGGGSGGGAPPPAWPDWPLPPGVARVAGPPPPDPPHPAGGRRGKHKGGKGGGAGGGPHPAASAADTSPPTLVLVEGPLLGGGAFARVTAVAQAPSGRVFALKRMPKAALAPCPEHVFCEQAITRSAAHPLCVRQYASFQDASHLYMLFDALPGGDLMDVLVAEARVVLSRVPRGPGPAAGAAAAAPGGSTGKAAPPPPPRPPPWWLPPCFAPRTRLLRGMAEPLARFYAACVVEALAYLHDRGIVYRDLKPENVLVDAGGYARLGDFGFAKALDPATGRTYTFCGTPGYVAPENVLAHGYGPSVDWWGLGVLLYVLLTGRQPFSSPRTDDPMAVMRRIVDESWAVPLPPYLSPAGRDLLTKLLERKPHRRLGCGPRGVADVRAHRWFAGVDWAGLADRRVTPPRLPRPSDVAKRLADLAASEKGKARAAAGAGGGGGTGGGGKASAKEAADAAREADAVFAEF